VARECGNDANASAITRSIVRAKIGFIFCRTLQISHDPGWRGACVSTTRDSWGRCAVAPGLAQLFYSLAKPRLFSRASRPWQANQDITLFYHLK
jgi:hypothetical protein